MSVSMRTRLVVRSRPAALRTKLAAGFGLLILIVVACGVFVLSSVSQIRHETTNVRERSVTFATHLSAAAVEAKAAANDERGYLLTADADFRDEIANRSTIVRRELRAASAAAPNAAIAREVRMILGRYDTWVDAVDQEFDLLATDRAAAIDRALNANRDLRKGYEKTIEEATTSADRQVASSLSALDDAATQARTTVVIMIGLLVVASLLVGIALLRSVRKALRPVLERARQLQDDAIAGLHRGLQAMAEGDLTVDVDPRVEPLDHLANDEIGEVGRTVNSIRESTLASVGAYRESRTALSELVGRVAESAASLSTSSREMASSSEETGRAVGEIARAVSEVAAGAQRQVQSVERTREVTSDVGETTEASASSAQEAVQAAEQARKRASDGASAVSSATEAMDLVRDASRQAAEAINELGAKSEQIGGIVATITGIAEQTNLLALNAAIEAARAGEQGRGFAVVADEVRKLAEESQEAAASISRLIAEIQSQTARAVEVVETGAARSDESATTVEQAREAFARIDAEVDEVSRRMGDVADAVRRMAEGAGQVQENMAEITAVAEQSSASTEEVSASTEQTSASAQQVAAGAQQLAATAGELEELARRFKLTTG